MHRPSAEEFLLTLLDALEGLPPDFARRLAEVLARPAGERGAALRQLFEDAAGD